MLIKCPECELQVSDKAVVCPHCGFVINHKQLRKVNVASKRRRLPNGFGQITELKNKNLRNPFRAYVTVGKDSQGRCIQRPLKPQTYFPTYNEAYAALIEYNKNPYDLDRDLTVKQLYEKWIDTYFKTLKSKSGTRTITSAWRYCSTIYDMRAKDIRARHIKGCMDNGTVTDKNGVKHASANTKEKIKSMFNLMFDYALEFELVDKNYARTFKLSDEVVNEAEEAKKPHIDFTDEEIQTLWNHVDDLQYVDIVLFQCYSGWRPQEIGLLELKNVDLENGFITGGMKTPAGIDRLVPIHPKIKAIVERNYTLAQEIGSDYLFNCTDTHTHRSSYKMTYDKYRHRFDDICQALELNPEHRAHDPRVQFITMAKRYGVDEYAVKYMVGHQIKDVTEAIYTKRKPEWLQTEIRKIK